MADILARQRAIVGSTADWTANNIVLGNGELAIERVSSTDIRIKVGDGVSTFLALPYASSSSTGIPAAVQTALDAKVAKSGDTMTGPLVLSGDPVAALGAVTKQSLDAAVFSLSTSLSVKFDKSGGTFTGPVSLAADPTLPMQASTRQFAEGLASVRVAKSGDTMTGALVLAGDPVNALDAAPKQFVESGPWQTTVGGSSAYAGKVPRLNSVGVLDSSVVPPAASYIGAVNLTVAYALTGSFTAGNYYAISASGTIHSSWPSRLNGTPTTCSAGQFIYYNSNGKWDLVGEVSGATAINGKVDRTGDTMTGPLVLAGNPTLPLGAATRQFVEQFLPLSGGTLTGALTLAADPTLAMQASTRQFAEGLASVRVAKSGDTMTGPLTLSGAPTASLHAVTKDYVDTGLAGKADSAALAGKADAAATTTALAGKANLAGGNTFTGSQFITSQTVTNLYNVLLELVQWNASAGSQFSRITSFQNGANRCGFEVADQTNAKGTLLLQPFGGDVIIGNPAAVLPGYGGGNGFRVFSGGFMSNGCTGIGDSFFQQRDAPGRYINFWYGPLNSVPTGVGGINTNGTGTTFVTSSDYRLKNNIQPMAGALEKVMLLRPVTYTWKVDETPGQGFIAHELAEIIPDAVSGEKDAVDENGTPKHQGVDQSRVVATLTAAIQEQQALIVALTARVAALEARP